MRIACLSLFLTLSCGLASAFEVETQIFYEGRSGGSTLKVLSTADREAFEPIILAFQAEFPSVSVDYTIASTSDVMKAVSEEGAVFDLIISSAMDLQTKLANDGFAQTYSSSETDALPSWARWRDKHS